MGHVIVLHLLIHQFMGCDVASEFYVNYNYSGMHMI